MTTLGVPLKITLTDDPNSPDTHIIGGTPHPTHRRAALRIDYNSRNRRMLGWNISHVVTGWNEDHMVTCRSLNHGRTWIFTGKDDGHWPRQKGHYDDIVMHEFEITYNFMNPHRLAAGGWGISHGMLQAVFHEIYADDETQHAPGKSID